MKSPRTACKSRKLHKSRKLRKSPRDCKSLGARKSRKVRIALVVALVVALICGGLLVFAGLHIHQWVDDNTETVVAQEEASEVADVHEVVAEEGEEKKEEEIINPPESKQDDYWYYVGLPFYEANFNELRAKNPDTVAFIHMSNTNVNYPVVQTTDNDYYIHHAFDKSENDAGWVFMDYRSVLPADNTVVYGHGRYNGTVFGSLRNLLTPEWQADKDNYAIWISTPTENFVYQIFSIYTIDAEGYYLRQNFVSPDDKLTWLKDMESRDVTPSSAMVSVDDKILTLSTCKDDFGNRIAVHAKLVKRQVR